MNQKRRAELQRKLTLKAVPRPPAGLAERIKSDIPKYLQPEPEHERFSNSLAFNLRLAASILLVVASVFVAFEVLTPTQMRTAQKSAAPALTPTALEYRTATNTAAETLQSQNEVQVEITQAAPPAARPQSAARVAAPAAPMVARAEERLEDETRRERDQPPQVGSVAGGAVAPDFVATQETTQMAAAPEAAPPPPPAAAPAPVAAGNSASLVGEAYADTLSLAPQKSVFGISVDPEVFGRIKTTIENGGRPDASAVNVEAIVNYFAGAPQRPVRRDVNLEVEASPAPVEMDGDHAVLRFSVDTVKTNVAPGATIPPIAKDARIEIDVNPTAVESIHRIGESDSIAPQSTLLRNLSVTGLYALELRPGIRASQRIVTVRLRYTSVANGRTQTIERTVHGHDLTKEWKHASRRHRLASLGAMWGEALKGVGGGATDVARRAEELATQDPHDQRARELAKAANATGGER